ncbi:SPOR domain-containing protein [Thauera propionica]|jgi:cell division septation protein DedD|uniref:SPOR domain-containing protein n=1 Tax=Thauera propionica TaxID=2019431 RepID=UPI0023F5660A|nr:SPOR domain-containing protein [Thauera propionica]MDD3674926.1 SPOR domain-containing protein [Thauera propionica]
MNATSDPQLGQRNRALKRAGLALAAAGLLLVVALMLEQQGTVPERAVAGDGQIGVPPAAPVIAIRTPEAPVQPEPGATRDAQDTLPAPADAVTPVARAAPSPTPVSGEAPVQPVTPAADAAPEVQAAPIAPPSALPVIPPAPADGFRIQLGVFGDPANALTLQRELTAKGLPATIQSRVVLGPFTDRAAAEKAQAALRKAGHEAGMLLPPVRKKP